MQHTHRRKFILLAFTSGLFIFLISPVSRSSGITHAQTIEAKYTAANCSLVGNITSQSLLVVLLDRSGSLIDQPGATDPDGYSTSVTKALADLWPGQMAVIPFSNENTPVLGPNSLAVPNQRQELKGEVQSYPIGGSTPLDPAMQKALVLLKGAPAGSRVIIVTDGSPEPPVLNGVNQADDIRQKLIPQFCAVGIPISAFGLALDLTQPDGQTANALLSDIANGTGGIYTNVRNAHELAQVVVQLYAQWQHLTFLPAQLSSSTYTVRIDTYAKRVTFVTFRSSDTYTISLDGPDGQPIPDQSVQRSTDRHYEIDNMTLSDINQPGMYMINVSGDAQAQAYALVETRLHVVLMQPSTGTTAYIGQPLQIQAELLDGTVPVIPRSNEATLNAQVQVLIDGRIMSTTAVELVQVSNSPVFAGKITLHGPPGQVHIQIEAVYLQIPVEASLAQITIPLEKMAVVIPPAPSCGTNVGCYLTRYQAFLIAGLSALLLALLLIFVLRPRKSKGWEVVQGGQVVDLGTMGRPLMRRLFHKSVISSQELESHGGLDFHGAGFVLIFKGNVQLVATGHEPKITIKQAGRTLLVTRDGQQGVELSDKDAIQVQGCRPATLHLQIVSAN